MKYTPPTTTSSFGIPFNIPYLTGDELDYITQVHQSRKLAGNGPFTQRCQRFIEARYGFPRVLLTTSCTDALEMAAILCRLGPGDQVIMPSYTYVSTANAFLRTGCDIVFADSQPRHPNIDADDIERLITPRTRVIVPVHYGGLSCDMDAIMDIARRHGLMVVEDAAQAIGSRYRRHPAGSFGHIAAFSFHETKNIQCGEGGMLVINDPRLIERAEVIWEKGTNRARFSRGEIAKYGWCDTGSSFLPSEQTAATLWAQLQHIDAIQQRRKALWDAYYQAFLPMAQRGCFDLPQLSDLAEHNGHIFCIMLADAATRYRLIRHLANEGIQAAFHYESLHKSAYFRSRHDGRSMPNADRYSRTLLRMPLYHDLTESDISRIARAVESFFVSGKAAEPLLPALSNLILAAHDPAS